MIQRERCSSSSSLYQSPKKKNLMIVYVTRFTNLRFFGSGSDGGGSGVVSSLPTGIRSMRLRHHPFPHQTHTGEFTSARVVVLALFRFNTAHFIFFFLLVFILNRKQLPKYVVRYRRRVGSVRVVSKFHFKAFVATTVCERRPSGRACPGGLRSRPSEGTPRTAPPGWRGSASPSAGGRTTARGRREGHARPHRDSASSGGSPIQTGGT